MAEEITIKHSVINSIRRCFFCQHAKPPRDITVPQEERGNTRCGICLAGKYEYCKAPDGDIFDRDNPMKSLEKVMAGKTVPLFCAKGGICWQMHHLMGFVMETPCEYFIPRMDLISQLPKDLKTEVLNWLIVKNRESKDEDG